VHSQPPDYTLDRLLDLAGTVIVLSDDGTYWVKFDAKRVQPTATRPHGIDYSLTMHGPGNRRLIGFDNAHPVPPQKWGEPQDHKHTGNRTLPYEYADAAQLLADFWAAVDRVKAERGIS
jgi:hypothetical protein